MIERLYRGPWIEGNPRFLSERLHSLNRTMKMRSGFRMNGQDIGARFRERIEERVDGSDHEMNIERQFTVPAKRFDDSRTDGEVRNEMAIHDVDVNPIGPCFIDRADFFAEFRKIGGKDGRGDDRGAGALDHGSD